MTIIERIYEELDRQGLKASALCEYVGISTGQLSTWKKRGTDPKAIYIPKIAAFLNKSQNYILTGEEKWEPTLTEKDERDIQKDLDNILNKLDNETGLMFDGEVVDEETRAKLRISLEIVMRGARKEAKEKFTPKKYRK